MIWDGGLHPPYEEAGGTVPHQRRPGLLPAIEPRPNSGRVARGAWRVAGIRTRALARGRARLRRRSARLPVCTSLPSAKLKAGPPLAAAAPLPRMCTRNGRVLFSFGNWIAVLADHCCREGIRRRMPDFCSPSIGEFSTFDRQVANMSFHCPSLRAGQQRWPRAEDRKEEWEISLGKCKKVQESAMNEEPLGRTKTHIALAVAQGLAFAVWRAPGECHGERISER